MLAGLILLAALGLGLGLMAYIRFAPSDPDQWHVAVPPDGPPPPDALQGAAACAGSVTLVPKGALARCLLAAPPAEVLAQLEDLALTAPRVQHLAGSPQEGRITWIARTFLMGYPDYITAEARQTPDGTRLDIWSRQRFGSKDFGVNAARLRAWLAQLPPKS